MPGPPPVGEYKMCPSGRIDGRDLARGRTFEIRWNHGQGRDVSNGVSTFSGIGA
jgi:hypothetical protein